MKLDQQQAEEQNSGICSRLPVIDERCDVSVETPVRRDQSVDVMGKTVEEWLGPGGKKLSAEFIEIWRAFAAEHASLTIADIGAELDRIRAYQRANPHPSRAVVAGLPDSISPAT